MEIAFEKVLIQLIEQHKDLYQFRLKAFRIVGENSIPLEPMFKSIKQLFIKEEPSCHPLALNTPFGSGIHVDHI
jgi:hypothetical protein